jgi:twitching motility protein PilT
MDIKKYFAMAIEAGASDVHLVGGELPMMRVAGQLKELSDKKIDNKELEEAVMAILIKEKKEIFAQVKDVDFAYVLANARFRVNLHEQDDKIGLAARTIPEDIPTPDDLRLEPAIRNVANLLDGLVLITGPTGSGKSTTIASIIEEINKSKKTHIITVEDPIEFAFKDKMSLIEQREVGRDTNSFADALKYALRQDPNVIFIGEMRDPETISTALTAAETGHLVLSTLHTPTAAEAVERIVDVFEGPKQKQILIQLSSVLRMVVAQQLVVTTDGRQVAAREILVNTSAVANLVRENNINQIKSMIQTGAKDGMVTMENSIKELFKDGLIDQETADKRSGRHRES